MKPPRQPRGESFPKTCGKAHELLATYYETENLALLSRKSGVSRSTLAYWKSCPGARMRESGFRHLRRIFSDRPGSDSILKEGSNHPDVMALLEIFQEVRDVLSRIEQQLLRLYS